MQLLQRVFTLPIKYMYAYIDDFSTKFRNFYTYKLKRYFLKKYRIFLDISEQLILQLH